MTRRQGELARTLSLALLCVAYAHETSAAQDPVKTSFGLDHVILRTGVLREGMEEFARRTGVTPTIGGQHPGRGTKNALVSLGQGKYLELLAPVVDAPSAGPLQLVGWAIHTDQINGVSGFLGNHGHRVSEPAPGSRKRPDGSMLKWSSAGLLDSGYVAAPFFIQWDSSSVHPSATSPTGCTLQSFTVTDVAPFRTIDLLETLGMDIGVERGSRQALTLVLTCPRGQVTFGS